MNERETKLAQIEQNQTDRQRLVDEGNKLNAELAELDKRHGDYGYDYDRKPCLRIYGHCPDYQFTVANRTTTFGNDSGSAAVPKIILGNIFDDLERNSEYLKEFKTDIHTYKFDFEKVSHAPIYIAGNWHTMAEAEEHHQKLGQLIATAKRKAK